MHEIYAGSTRHDLLTASAQQSTGSQSREPASCHRPSTKQRAAKDQGVDCSTRTAIIARALPCLRESAGLVELPRGQVVGRRLEPDAVRPGEPRPAEEVVEH